MKELTWPLLSVLGARSHSDQLHTGFSEEVVTELILLNIRGYGPSEGRDSKSKDFKDRGGLLMPGACERYWVHFWLLGVKGAWRVPGLGPESLDRHTRRVGFIP